MIQIIYMIPKLITLIHLKTVNIILKFKAIQISLNLYSMKRCFVIVTGHLHR